MPLVIPMKLVHISDIHIHDQAIMGSEPVSQFCRVLDHVGAHHGDADRIVITGDLTHHGQDGSYKRLKEILDSSPLQGELRPRLMIGNHDDRETFLANFGDTPRDDAGFVQWREDTSDGRFLYLDTVENGYHHGTYCATRQAWLESELEQATAEEMPVFVFMHHNPVKVHVANADLIGIVQAREMKTILGRYRDTVRHVFFGHCHYTLSGSVAGIPFSAPRSTNHPCWPDFSGNPRRMGYGDLKSDYNVCFISDSEVVVHSIDFEQQETVRWMVTGADGWIEEEKAAG